MKLLDKKTANSYVRDAYFVSIIIALIVLAEIAYKLYEHGWGSVPIRDYLDLCLMVGFAFGIYKRSVFAVTAALLYYLGSRAYHLFTVSGDQASYVLIIVVFVIIYFYVQGTRGALALRKMKMEASSEP